LPGLSAGLAGPDIQGAVPAWGCHSQVPRVGKPTPPHLTSPRENTRCEGHQSGRPCFGEERCWHPQAGWWWYTGAALLAPLLQGAASPPAGSEGGRSIPVRQGWRSGGSIGSYTTLRQADQAASAAGASASPRSEFPDVANISRSPLDAHLHTQAGAHAHTQAGAHAPAHAASKGKASAEPVLK